MILKLDPHIHSSYSPDAISTPSEIIKKSKELNLDIIGISDHNTIEGSQLALKETKNDDELLVMPSIEISSKYGHILGFGIEEMVKRGLSAEETVDKIHELGGLAIVPHPYSYYRHGLFCKEKNKDLNIDGVETKNARFILGYSNYKGKKLAEEKNIAELGSSDAHYKNFIMDCYSEIDCEKDIDSVLKAIKKRKTKALGNGTSNIMLTKYFYKKHIKKEFK
ncbi:PHP domain-containing protein [uncultured Methanobrevibacter sp.]|uniref:PHP domain-containing protein n=1 Tax=uncultured Methanobrevibacter sp. TaxID=253161 RepID=UPI0025F71D60|nr:PHP domain-containing protein [uncultured Methanobrevibacter sp.]